jgi:uncharacterized protein YqjF (DUF2071 family)
MAKHTFLKAKWQNLIMLNYEVPAELLKPYVPPGTELDVWQGKCLASMVGFMFNNTSVLGIKWPGHVSFEEVNLRFYVRYNDNGTWKRGAVFISEIVPKPIISFTANILYQEHYRTLPMRHSQIALDNDHALFAYEWKLNGRWNKIEATVENIRDPIQPGSAEEFILEHYWGYNELNSKTTMEYQVEHVSWLTGKVTDYTFDADVAALYGEEFVPYLQAKPYSAFFADGSEIGVRFGQKIVV